MNRPKRVIVLGCGPAGLIAAHSAVLSGADVRIFSKPRKSFMRGAQYLHKFIEGTVWHEPFTVNYTMQGTPEQYRLKVYGPTWDGTVSPQDLEETHKAWDIRVTYDWLWDTYGPYVQDWEASPATMRSLLQMMDPDVLVSTVPAPLLCAQGHAFTSSKIFSTNKSLKALPDNTVLCNGEEFPSWYRASRIQDWENTEWPDMKSRPPITPMWEVTKPLATNCDCLEGLCAELDVTLLRGGRYGKWQKGVLSHEVEQEVALCLAGIRSPQS